MNALRDIFDFGLFCFKSPFEVLGFTVSWLDIAIAMAAIVLIFWVIRKIATM